MREGVVMWAGGRNVNTGIFFADICGECDVNTETVKWMWRQLREHGNNYVNGGRSCEWCGDYGDRWVIWMADSYVNRGQTVMRTRGSYEIGAVVWMWDTKCELGNSYVNRGSDTNEGMRIRRIVMWIEGQKGCSHNTYLLREQLCKKRMERTRDKLHQGYKFLQWFTQHITLYSWKWYGLI